MNLGKRSCGQRIISAVCALAMIIGIVPFGVFAEGRDYALTLNLNDSSKNTGTIEVADFTPAVVTSAERGVCTAEIDSGDIKVTAVGAGETTITVAESEAADAQKAEFWILVKANATGVQIEKSSLPQEITVGTAFPTMSATTTPAEPYCNDTIKWSVSSNKSGVTIDETSGALTFGTMTENSEVITVTATAGTVSDTYAFTLNRQDLSGMISWPVWNQEYGAVTELSVTPEDYNGKLSFKVLDEQGSASTAAKVEDGVLTVLEANKTFKVKVTGSADGNYKEFTAESPLITSAPKTLTAALPVDFSLEKTSDGTLALTPENIAQLTQGLNNFIAENKVGEDDIVLIAETAAAEYGAYFGTTTVEGIKLTLSGGSLGNYILASDQMPGIPAKVNGLPISGEKILDLTKNNTLEIHGVTFSGNLVEGNEATSGNGDKYWLNGTSNIAVTGIALDQEGSPVTEVVDSNMEIYVQDSSNRVYGPYELKFQRDTAAPVVEISGASQENMELGHEAVTYTVTVYDQSAQGVKGGVGVDKVYYFIGSDAPAQEAAEWQEISLDTDSSFTVTVPTSGNLYAKTVDKVGNVSVSDIIKTIVLEETAPTVEMSCDDAATYKQSHIIKVTAQDSATEGTAPYNYSGIQKIYYSLTAQGESEALPGYEQVEMEGTNRPEAMGDIPSLRTVVKEVEIQDSALTGSYTLEVWTVDWCGNTSETKSIDLKFDNTQPELKLEVTGGNCYPEADYFNSGFEVKFTVTDNLPFEESDFQPQVVKAPENVQVNFNAVMDGEGKSCTYTATIQADDAQGEYQFAIIGKDTSGNNLISLEGVNQEQNAVSAYGDGYISRSKIVDTTAPAATVTYDALDDSHVYGKTSYYSGNVQVNIAYQDNETLDAANLSYQCGSGTLNDDSSLLQVAEYPEKEHPVENGSSAEGILTIDQDGAYRIQVAGQDKAGNPLVVSETRTGNVDPIQENVSTETEPFQGGINLVRDTKEPTAVVTLPALEQSHIYGITSYYKEVPVVQLSIQDENALDGTKIAYGISDVVATPLADENSKITGEYTEADLTLAGTSEMSLVKEVSLTSADGAYQIRLKGEDKAGNKLLVTEMRAGTDHPVQEQGTAGEGYFTSTNLVLDTVNPTFALSIEPNSEVAVQDRVGDRYYFNGNYTATVTVYETNFAQDKIAVNRGVENAEDYDAGSVVVDAFDSLVAYANNQTFVDQSDLMDGVYRYAVFGTDKAGNELRPNPNVADLAGTMSVEGEDQEADLTCHIVVDKTEPDGVLSIKEGTEEFYKMLLKAGTIETANPYRDNTSVTVEVIGEDHSPVSIRYNLVTVTGNPDEEKEEKTVSYATSEDQEYAFKNVLPSVAEGEQIFKVKDIILLDRAGNSTTVATSNRIYLDGTEPTVDELAPNVTVEIGPTANKKADAIDDYNGPKGNPLFDQDVPLHIKVSDPNAGIKSSGLSEVSYRLYINGQEVAEDALVLREASTTEWDENYEDPTLEFDLEKLVTVVAATHNYNDIRVVVTAEDNAGNINNRELRFGIDITKPTIEISFDNNDAQNGKYFKADRVATIVVTERNFDPSKISIDTESNQISSWSRTDGTQPNGDDDQWTCKVSYTIDGNYTLGVTGKDLLGHNADDITYNGTAPRDFVIDKTAPVVTVSFDNNDVRNGRYYNAARNATISVNDANFDGTNDIAVSATRGGAAPAVAFASGIAVLPFTVDGNYSFAGTVTDMAGNVSAPLAVEEFVIDQTAPELSIQGVENGAAYPAEVTPQILFGDMNYDANTVTLTRSVLEKRNEDVSQLLNAQGGVSVGADGFSSGTITYQNLEYIQDNDGIYSISAIVTDLAGNSTTREITYLVNRFGSVYVYSEALAGMIGGYYQKAESDLYITAYNVSPLVEDSAKLQITCDGTAVENQVTNADAANARRQNENGWYEYRFDVSNQDLTKDGRYEITLSDVDEAGNTKTNAENPIWFYLDTTKPSLDSVIGLEKAIVNADSQAVSYVGSDAIALESIEVYLDGEEIQLVEEFDGNVHEDSFVVGTGLRQNVRFVLTDKAGNVLDTASDFKPAYIFNQELTVSTNFFVRWYANTPLFWGSIAVIVVAAGAGIFMMLSKRRKKEETEV